ncbi:aldo/keto reductase [Paracoccus sp. S-4012]|uniref:aldo/keto reductase n=1 Tax=Paracoccus sp. S-4012 TaxID=2665648 RepID=UPI0012AFA9BC|nr:aldo/keto reductase [Paracoccus sp. S-4012]MRX49004.1 aldo/keto reductase [Paracoccus sp. S-4012]
MQRVRLGGTDVEVSEVCLGTMTYANQTGREDAFAQMDRALDAGITFLDCAEMYPVNPVRPETVGDSERMIGAWLKAHGTRNRVEIATKVSGPNPAVRGGAGFDGASIATRVAESLERLGVETIDLYQLHVPMRPHYHFRRTWTFAPSSDRDATLRHMDEVMAALAAEVQAGRIRAVGLSNETAWGTARWIDAAARHGLTLASIQNEYSLLCRLYDTDLAELGANEGVTLLAYSPLAAGLLTGKYASGTPQPSRAANDIATGGAGDLGGRRTPRADEAVAAYHEVAQRHGLDPVRMALAFTRQRPFPVIPIIGATTDAQLAHLLDGLDLRLSAEVLDAVAEAHKAHPQPF